MKATCILLLLAAWLLPGHIDLRSAGLESPAPAREPSAGPSSGSIPEPQKHPSCATEGLHPIDVQVRVVGPLVPGQWSRATIELQSRLDLTQVELQLQPRSQVQLLGAHKAGLADVQAAATITRSFTFRVPDVAEPQQIDIVVRGHANGQPLERGTVLHLLPQGPRDSGIASEAPSVHGPVIEYRASARRVR